MLLVLVALANSLHAQAQDLANDTHNSPASTKPQPEPTPLVVKLRLAEAVSSATAQVGERVRLRAVEPVEINGKVVVVEGATALGTVSAVRRSGHKRREGKLQITIDTVSRVDGTEAQLRSASLRAGSGKGEPIFGPCTFPLPADPVGLFRKGENVVIPEGTELIATLAPDTRL